MTGKQPSEKAMKEADALCAAMEGETWKTTSHSSWLIHSNSIARALDDFAEAARREENEACEAKLLEDAEFWRARSQQGERGSGGKAVVLKNAADAIAARRRP